MSTNDPRAPISRRMIESVMSRYTPEKMQWHYEHGLVLQSVYAAANVSGNTAWKDWIKSFYDTKILEDGSILSYKKDEFNLDQINPGKNLFDLLADYGEEKYRRAIEILRNQLAYQPRVNAGGFWHKQIYPAQMWLDGLYMQAPFFVRYGRDFGTKSDIDDAISQLILAEDKTRDPKTGLLYHAWDESRRQLWADRQTGCSPHFWARAMGWYCMALTDVFELILGIDESSLWRSCLCDIGNRLAPALLSYQDEASGMWYQVMDQGKRDKNYLETSSTAMFAYFFLKGSRLGLLDNSIRETAVTAGKKAYAGMCAKMLSEDSEGNLHLDGICSVAGLGGNPYRDGSF